MKTTVILAGVFFAMIGTALSQEQQITKTRPVQTSRVYASGAVVSSANAVPVEGNFRFRVVPEY